MKLESPLNVDVLLWYYARPEPHPKAATQLVKDFSHKLHMEDFLEWNTEGKEGFFQTTEKGNAWVRMILNLESPKMAFVNERGEVV